MIKFHAFVVLFTLTLSMYIKPSYMKMYSTNNPECTDKSIKEEFTETWPQKSSDYAILFYDKNDPYYEFTNTYLMPIVLDNRQWPSVEHYFQAGKFKEDLSPNDKDKLYKNVIYDKNGTIRGPGSLQKLALKKEYPFLAKNLMSNSNWRKINTKRMLTGLETKFKKGWLRRLLLNTGNKILVEDAKGNDNFYGAGQTYTGCNRLGQMLMWVREKLRAEEENRQPLEKEFTMHAPSYWRERLEKSKPVKKPTKEPKKEIIKPEPLQELKEFEKFDYSDSDLKKNFTEQWPKKETKNVIYFEPESKLATTYMRPNGKPLMKIQTEGYFKEKLDDWRSVEDFYQAGRFKEPSEYRNNLATITPETLQKMAANEFNQFGELRIESGDLPKIKDQRLLMALREKFKQNEDLKQFLLDTKNKLLVNAREDELYGVANNNKGVNLVGRLLMHIRNEFKEGKETQYKAQSLSELYKKLGGQPGEDGGKKKSPVQQNLQKLASALDQLSKL